MKRPVCAVCGKPVKLTPNLAATRHVRAGGERGEQCPGSGVVPSWRSRPAKEAA